MKWKVGFALCLRRRANNSFLLPSCEGGGVWQMHNCLPTYSSSSSSSSSEKSNSNHTSAKRKREKQTREKLPILLCFLLLPHSVPSVRFPLIYTKKKIRDIRWRVVKNIPALSRQNFPSSSSSSSSPIPKLGKTPAR